VEDLGGRSVTKTFAAAGYTSSYCNLGELARLRHFSLPPNKTAHVLLAVL